MNYKGDKVGYSGLHRWLNKEFKDISVCESKECKNISKKLHWALKKGCTYQRKRENFLRLCASCHKIYDMTDEVRANLSKAHIGLKSHWKGKTRSSSDRLKISKGTKLGMARAGYTVNSL